MGKVKDGSSSSKSVKVASKGGPVSAPKKARFAPFFANLASAAIYKPLQGRLARIWTAVGLGLVIFMGLRELWLTLDANQATFATVYGVPAVLGAVLGWVTFRLLQFPPFVEFLIATEAEMNKVSWTSRDDLKRATTVVLVTVLLMAVFLFGVDWVWMQLLRALGVLRLGDASQMGSQG